MADQLKWHVSPSDKSEGGGMFWIEQDGTDAGLATLHVANAFGGTTDEQWDGVVAHISAAPEMLTLLRDLRREISDGSILDAGNIENYGREIDAVLAKAEPPRKVKHTVWVTVKVEVEADVGTSDEEIRTRASDSVYTGSGPGVTIKERQVAGRRELYEE